MTDLLLVVFAFVLLPRYIFSVKQSVLLVFIFGQCPHIHCA